MVDINRKEQLEQELSRITALLIQRYAPERVILFGSLARGDVHEWSGIDLAIVKETPARFIDRIGDVLYLTRPQIGVNIVVYTPNEVLQMERTAHYFWMDEIVGKGKALYDRAS